MADFDKCRDATCFFAKMQDGSDRPNPHCHPKKLAVVQPDRRQPSCRAPGHRCVDMLDCYTSKGCQFAPDDNDAAAFNASRGPRLGGVPRFESLLGAGIVKLDGN